MVQYDDLVLGSFQVFDQTWQLLTRVDRCLQLENRMILLLTTAQVPILY